MMLMNINIIMMMVAGAAAVSVSVHGGVEDVQICVSIDVYMNLFFYLARQSPVGHGLLMHEVSRSHTATHHSR
jgi:hypothetical protein